MYFLGAEPYLIEFKGGMLKSAKCWPHSVPIEVTESCTLISIGAVRPTLSVLENRTLNNFRNESHVVTETALALFSSCLSLKLFLAVCVCVGINSYIASQMHPCDQDYFVLSFDSYKGEPTEIW